jgi:hypothetical protein
MSVLVRLILLGRQRHYLYANSALHPQIVFVLLHENVCHLRSRSYFLFFFLIYEKTFTVDCPLQYFGNSNIVVICCSLKKVNLIQRKVKCYLNCFHINLEVVKGIEPSRKRWQRSRLTITSHYHNDGLQPTDIHVSHIRFKT